MTEDENFRAVFREAVAPTVGRRTSWPAPVACPLCRKKTQTVRGDPCVRGRVIIRVGLATISNRLRAVGRAGQTPIGRGNAARRDPSLVVDGARR